MNDEMAQAVYKQAFENWINPDILERHARGEVTLPVKVHSAQIVFGIDGSKQVRINSEVKGKFKAKLKKDVKKGDFLTYNDVDGIHFSEQAPEDKDYGHITLVSAGDDKWSVSFSFLYGAEKVNQYLSLGKEFLHQANLTVKGSSKASVALGMTAAENLIKARLAASPLVASVQTKKHNQLFGIFNSYQNQKAVKKLDKSYLEAYKFFNKHFNSVRYDPSYHNIHRLTLKKHLSALGRLENETSKLVADIDLTSLASRQIKIDRSTTKS